MLIQEPLTLATDSILAAASLVFGVLLLRRGNRTWAIAFFFTAAGSFCGGIYHGFGGEIWWKAMIYAIGGASLFLLAPFMRIVAFAIFFAYAAWMTVHDSFLWVCVDYGITLVLLLFAYRSRWVVASVAVAAVAVAFQQAPIPFHNDVYHAVQLVAMWLLYRAGTVMTTETVRSMIPPT